MSVSVCHRSEIHVLVIRMHVDRAHEYPQKAFLLALVERGRRSDPQSDKLGLGLSGSMQLLVRLVLKGRVVNPDRRLEVIAEGSACFKRCPRENCDLSPLLDPSGDRDRLCRQKRVEKEGVSPRVLRVT